MKTAIALLCALTMLVAPTSALAMGSPVGKEPPAAGSGTETAASYDYTATYDYIEFGSYPQTEIAAKASDSGVYKKAWETESDYIIDPGLYSTLKSLSEDQWDANGDATVDGARYRRIKASDATYSTSDDSNYYNWSSSDTYHYFKYEPIKWRVLEQNGSDAFLVSDIALDDQMYNTKISGITWETSTIRSWLNGYGSSSNAYGTDYSSSNFIDTAFTAAEQSRIKTTVVETGNNSKSDTEGGNDTSDKIFLLSEDEVYGSSAAGYGFANDYNAHDTARQAKSSTYAKAMGAYADCEGDCLGNCFWWLRSPGSYTGLFILIRCNGSVYRGGQHADSKTRGVHPAMHLILDDSQAYDDVVPEAANAEAGLSNFLKTSSVSGSPFADVSENDWYYQNVRAVYEYGLMDGTGSSQFSPDGALTVAEAVTLACRLYTTYYGYQVSFPAGDSWYDGYVAYAKTTGIIQGDQFTDYDRPISRREIAQIFARALPEQEFESIHTVNSIPDVAEASQGYAAIRLLYSAGILTGTDAAGSFSPEQTVTRGQIAAIMTRIVEPGLRK